MKSYLFGFDYWIDVKKRWTLIHVDCSAYGDDLKRVTFYRKETWEPFHGRLMEDEDYAEVMFEARYRLDMLNKESNEIDQ